MPRPAMEQTPSDGLGYIADSRAQGPPAAGNQDGPWLGRRAGAASSPAMTERT
jgi:hypothetical protein